MSRILNRQRQLAEQGRIRLGFTTETSNGKTRPVRSETFVLTSHSREHIEHAASLWGGEVEHWQPQGNGAKQWRVITQATVIPAILPPGDPLTQAYEMWSKGGCQRRCDGMTEQFSGSPCLCLAQHGEQWFELGPRDVCVTKSRLKVLLPDMPGLGAWRLETGSFYATDEIAGMVDTIRGAVGDQVLVPVALRIEQRTRIAGGQTKHFVVPVLELRGVTAGALLSGEARSVGALASNEDPTRTPAAIEAGLSTAKPAEDVVLPTLDDIAGATNVDVVYNIHRFLTSHDAMTPALDQACKDRVAALQASQPGDAATAPAVPAVPSSDGDGDADAIWQRILATAGSFEDPWTTSQVIADYEQRYAMNPGEASAAELAAYLQVLQAEGRAA